MTYIGYCGDDCELFPRYIATQSNDVEQLKQAAILWKIVGLSDHLVPPEEMICNGCASLEKCHYNNIRECNRDKEISSCGKCTEYPCDKLIWFLIQPVPMPDSEKKNAMQKIIKVCMMHFSPKKKDWMPSMSNILQRLKIEFNLTPVCLVAMITRYAGKTGG